MVWGDDVTKLTPKKRAAFISHLGINCNVTLAAESIKMSRGYMYEVKAADPEFASEWENALDEGVDRLEAEAHRRGFKGVDRPVYQGGEMVGHIREYSDTLAIFLLKSHRPDKYRENRKVELGVDDKLASLMREIDGKTRGIPSGG